MLSLFGHFNFSSDKESSKKVINNIGFGFDVSESNFTLIGMAGLIAGVIHAPLTAIFLIAEITGGYELFVPLMITGSISYLLTKNILDYTIYTKELVEKDATLSHLILSFELSSE